MQELGRPVDGQTATSEVLDTQGYLGAVYDRLGIEAALGAYLGGQSGAADEHDIDMRLAEFSMALADAATMPVGAEVAGGVNVATVRLGVDHLTRNMNEVCSAKFGYKRASGWPEAILRKLGIVKTDPGRYVRYLDDRYWGKQFPEQYAEQRMVQREPGENEKQYLGRYIQTVIHGFIFAPFTFMAS